MTKYSFILLSGDQEKFLDGIRQLGVVDITRSTKPVDDKSASMLSEASDVKKALALISGADYDGDADFSEIEARAAALDVNDGTAEEKVRAAFAAAESLESLSAGLQAAEKEKKQRLPWGEFDKSGLEKLSSAGYAVKYYSVPKKQFSSEWASQVPLQVIGEASGNVWFVTVSPVSEPYSFPVAEIPAPGGDWRDSDMEISRIKEDILNQKAVLQALKKSEKSLSSEYDRLLSEMDVYIAGTAGKQSSENMVTTFVGFAPSSEDARLCAEFDKMDVFWFKEAAAVEDNPPIRLHNNKFVSMFELLTDMYGRPAYNGFDPTSFISVFFMLFFAFCMGDAGYGIILMIIGLSLKKVKSFASMSPLVVTLGAATVVVGFLFHTFFSCDISTWACIPDAVKHCFLPSKIMGYDGTMVLSIIVGIVHISLAMIVKTYMATRNNGFLNSLGTWGWTLLIVGGVATGLFSLIGVLGSEVTRWVIIGLGSVSAVGIFLLNDIHRNPLLNIGSGLWETYNTATGLLGDVLSYLRLYALGLAGSMLGLAFNSIGMMIVGDGNSPALWIAAVLVFIVGHTLNIAMAALGAFVHPLRLNFLEFFKNSGYEAEGRNYNPLQKIETNQ